MANIIKISGYLIDPNEEYQGENDIEIVLERYTDMMDALIQNVKKHI